VLVAQTQLLRAQEGVAKIQAERLGAHASLVTALGAASTNRPMARRRTKPCRRMAKARAGQRAVSPLLQVPRPRDQWFRCRVDAGTSRPHVRAAAAQ